MDNILYPIALTCIKGIGPMLAKRLIEQLGSAERIFREKRGMLERTPGIGQTLAEAIIRQRDEALQRAGEELEFIRRYGIRTYYIDDANYPTRLKQCQDAPLVLFGKGETDLNAVHFIGIVGTRRPTEQGRNNCHKLVATGEYVLGVTIEKSAVQYADNPDIGYVYPEKNSAVPDGVALIKNCPNPENAKLFIDFVTGKECQTAQNADWARRPVRSDITPVGLAELSTLDLGDYDFTYAATNKESIVEKWNDLTVG